MVEALGSLLEVAEIETAFGHRRDALLKKYDRTD
jgi:hypothetical protein